LKALHKANEELKEYSHVNKKAYEQFRNFTEQRDVLLERKADLDKSAEVYLFIFFLNFIFPKNNFFFKKKNKKKAIEELIQTLDQRKDEAIERTFKQVAKNFSEVFKELVPNGKGNLIMKKKALDEEEPKKGRVDLYTGVAIKVSFSFSYFHLLKTNNFPFI